MSKPKPKPKPTSQSIQTRSSPISRTNIPNLHAHDIKLDAFVGKWFVAECLAPCTHASFEIRVDP